MNEKQKYSGYHQFSNVGEYASKNTEYKNKMKW